MRVLVTGGAGFIGSHLQDALLEQGHHVVCIDNLRNGSMDNISSCLGHERFRFQQGDIRDIETVHEVMTNIDVVYHLACLGVRHSIHSPFENHEVNAEGSLRVLEAARKHEVRKFFYISTSEVYGKALNFPIRETDPTFPLTVYGSSKLAGEHYTHSFHECYGLDTTVLRIFNNYGPRAHYEGDAGEVIPRSIVKIIYGENPVIFGDGSVTRDFFYVKDTARLLTDLIHHDRLTGKTLNVGTGIEVTIRELLESILGLMPEFQRSIDYLEPRPADVPRLWVDNSRLKDLVGLPSAINFKDGLRETIGFYVELSKKKRLLEDIKLHNWTA